MTVKVSAIKSGFTTFSSKQVSRFCKEQDEENL